MKKPKNILNVFRWSFLVFLLINLLLTFGCENDSSSSNGDFLLEKTCIIKGKSFIQPNPGDILIYNCGAYNVVITQNTRIFLQRRSCSGFDEVSDPYSLVIGMTLIVKYNKDDINYAVKPQVIRPTYVEAYWAECISVVPPGPCIPCEDKFFK